jgi:hypothetical protein
MNRVMRLAVLATGATLLSLSVSTVAVAAPSGSLVPPPGCTGDWNTTQAAVHNHAPGVAPGCSVAESHAR